MKHIVFAFVVVLPTICDADDWPEYRRDSRRSGQTDEQINASKLQVRWTWQSPYPPRPAWAGPAKRDAYRNIRGLPSMRDYDTAFHPVIAKGRVYFGSSVDDSLHCLDAESGEELWSFTTDGPVRIAPAVVEGRVYFGSDDSYAYCLDAEKGTLIWKFTPVDDQQYVLNNTRLISRWPCRTGVLVDRGTAYFANSLLPWKESYLCAVDAVTGKPEGEGRFAKVSNGLTLEGPLAATPEMLIAPQGRVAPRLFKRSDGASLGSLKGGGGSFVVLAADQIFHGPGADSRQSGIASSNQKTRTPIATYKKGNAIVVAGNCSFMLTDNSLIASDLAKRQHLWTIDCEFPFCLIAAADTIFVGGEDRIAGFQSATGELVATHPVDGKACGMAVADGQLFVATDTGAVVVFDQNGEKAKKPDVPKVVNQSLSPIKSVSDERLVGRWVFQSPHVEQKTVSDLAGKNSAKISGDVRLIQINAHQGLALDGRSTSVLVSADHNQVDLPAKELTAEAWVRVDQPLRWGGIMSAIQDNGSYERGWLLGYENSKFSFAVAGKDGPGNLTYLPAKANFELGKWFHVAGTYDGTTMKLFINGKLSATSTTQKGEINYPPKTFFEIGAYHDSNENYRLKGMVHETRVYRAALSAEEIKKHFESKAENFQGTSAQGDHIQLALGPWVQFTRPNEAVVRWHTEKPSPTILEYWLDGDNERVVDTLPKTQHEVTLKDLKHKREYGYAVHQMVDGVDQQTETLPFDTFFNYSPGLVADKSVGEYAPRAALILKESKTDRGICVDMGCGDGQLALELVKQSRMRLIGFETDPKMVDVARRRLKQAGVYGERVTIHHVKELHALPIPSNSVNLVMSTMQLFADGKDGSKIDVREIERILVPQGRAIFSNSFTHSGKARVENDRLTLIGENDAPDAVMSLKTLPFTPVWYVFETAAKTGTGEWSHLYGRADNSAFGGESLAGIRRSEDLEVQWIGRPGPRYQSDRGNRKPSPLSTGGRLFLQGWRRMIAVDAYNGTPIWSLEMPEFTRYNMPRDSSNWCSDEDFVYAAVRNKCWNIDARTGEIVKFLDIASDAKFASQFDWGYIASDGQQLMGTAVKHDTAWTNIWGGSGEGWYDAKSGPVTHMICSDKLFSCDKKTGELNWSTDRLVLNSTITIGAGRVYFVESRSDAATDSKTRRLPMATLAKDLHLVALDVTTGEKIWEKPVEMPDDAVVCYLAFSNEKLVHVTSSAGKYQVVGHDATNGKSLWKTPVTWQASHHGGHMSRPAIVGDKVYVRPASLDLYTGKLLPQRMPHGGCGTYACTTDALFFRSSTVTVWDREAGKATKWSRLRPDCWLSTIPAGGMLLSPEGGGGCSCGSWLETSIGFAPVQKK